MELPGLLPEFIHIWSLEISQTLFTSLVSTVFFVIFVFIYNFLKARNSKNIFVNVVDMFVEWMLWFFRETWEGLPHFAQKFIVFVFFYILWNNFFWLVWDLFSAVVPALHHYFRPVSTDIFFNMILAVFWVLAAIYNWYRKIWFHFFERYVPYKGLGFVDKVNWPISFIIKIFDVALALFVGFLEFVGEFTKILSLSLRLFWNIFAWVVLLMLVVWATISFIKVPLIFPLLVVFMETIVSFLQAFVFSLLVLVYFKMAESWH